MNSNFKWISFVNKRFSLVDRKGSASVTTRLSALGICFGVMTLIAVLSVMNGFQSQFIDSIIELSSYHVQATDVKEDKAFDFEKYLDENKSVVTYTRFMEAQSLMTSSSSKEAGTLIRALPKDIMKTDDGFAREMYMISGSFNIEDDDSIVIGNRLARNLGVKIGSTVNLFALSGSADAALISNERTFTVKGIFSCGYADINLTYAFINMDAAKKYFGNTPVIYGIKLKNQNADRKFQKEISKVFTDSKISVWRDYNRSFFGALRVEKNMIMLLVIMIFIVVAINIFNSMRKLVFERRTEISTLSSLGASSKSIQNVFIFRGLSIGLKGSVPGMILGLLISFNIKPIFLLISKVQFYIEYFSACIFNAADRMLVKENSMWHVYANIPAKVMWGEVVFITLFGIFSCVFASYMASSNILKIKIAEVLHEE